MGKLVAMGKLEMDKYIFEKFCLNDGEQILFESGGSIQWGGALSLGTLYVTNYRIISQGGIMLGKTFADHGVMYYIGKASLSDRSRIINFSLQQKCYGYIFPIKNLSKLKKRSNGVSYKVKLDKYTRNIRIWIAKIPNREEHINKLFDILSNE